MRGRRRTASGRESGTRYNPAIRWLKNRCQVGPTILFECPAQIPRSFLRSFSLWARHSAETSAELNGRSLRQNFSLVPAGSCEGEEAAEGRKCEGGAGNGSGRASFPHPRLPSFGLQNRCQVGPTILFECPAQIPAPSFDHFPFGPAILRR